MTIKQFIEEAIKIGHPKAFISAQVDANRYRDSETTLYKYSVWCSKCEQHTKDYENPHDALAEFELMHRPQQAADEMVISGGIITAPEQPAFLRKIMD